MKNVNVFNRIFAASLIITLIVTPTLFSQTTVQLTPTMDNTLYEHPSGSLSNGVGIYLFAGRTNQPLNRRALMAFDISAIPAGATITEVTLKLNCSLSSSGAHSMALHRVAASWGEGTSNAGSPGGQGANSTTGDATWIHRMFNSDNWSTAGGDFSPAASASTNVTGQGSYTWGSSSGLVDDVQHWLDNPSENFGWILIGNESQNKTAKRFDSRENGTESNRPLLTITYTPPTGIEDHMASVPREAVLFQNRPNPFNASTTIDFQISESGPVRLVIYSMLGQVVDVLVDGEMTVGRHSYQWNAQGLATGVYYYRLETSNRTIVRKLALLN